MSIRDQLAAFSKRRYKTLDCPGVGKVIIQSITEGERTDIINRAQNGHAGHINAMLISACLVDDKHRRIYSDSDADIEEIRRLDSQITQFLADAISEHITPPDVEELVGNSSETLAGSSQSDSQTN